MEKLNYYLLAKEDEEKDASTDCCKDEENIILSTDLLQYVCTECGLIQKRQYIRDIYEQYKNPLIVKTFIGYNGNKKYNAIHRLNKWSTWVYNENELNKMQNIIADLDIKHKDEQNIKRLAKLMLKDYYIEKKVVTRNNIRRALFVHCIKRAYEYIDEKVELNYLFKLLNITPKNYQNLLIKLQDLKIN